MGRGLNGYDESCLPVFLSAAMNYLKFSEIKTPNVKRLQNSVLAGGAE